MDQKEVDLNEEQELSPEERQLLFFKKTLFYLLQKMKLHDILLTSLETRPLETKTNQGFEKRA